MCLHNLDNPQVVLLKLEKSLGDRLDEQTIVTTYVHSTFYAFPGGSDGKESACSGEDLGSIPGLERSPGEGDGYPFQYSCLENPMAGYSS